MNKIIKLISEDIIYSKNLPECNNGLCDVYYFHGVDMNLIVPYSDECPLNDYYIDWHRQFKSSAERPAYLYNADTDIIRYDWNEIRYNLVLLLFLENGGKL